MSPGRARPPEPTVVLAAVLYAVGLLFLASGCAAPRQMPQERTAAAKALFDHTTKEFHLPSAEAQEPARTRLLAQAAAGYEHLLRTYADQTHWCALALRSLGNVRAAQGRLDVAVRLYARLAKRYPSEEWEVIQAWKSAADILWENTKRSEARQYYAQIVKRFDSPDAPAIVRTIVRGAKTRLTATE